MEVTEELMSAAKLLGIGSALNVALLIIIMWFIRRLIVKVDKIDVLEVQVKAIVHEMKDLSSLRERVAIIEDRMPNRKRV